MKVFCILSDERAFRSRSPAMFSAVLKRVGINGVYVPFMVEPENIGWAIKSLRVLNMAGANITIPYKELVIPHLDTLSEGATIIGAINTIVRSGKTLKGYNTNAIGFMDALAEAAFEPTGKSAVVFGTGGAAKAAVFILNWLRADSVIVAGRSQEKIAQVVNKIGGRGRLIASLGKDPLSAHIVVNATSVSSREESPELAELVGGLQLPNCELVFDLNYGRADNFWEALARSRGIRFMDGLPALAYQARRSFALWTGVQVPPGEFLKALEETR